MLNLTIYLIKKKNQKRSLDSYIQSDYLRDSNLSKYQINKEYLFDSTSTRGKIYIFEENNYTLPWSNTVNKLAKIQKQIIKKRQGKIKAVILLEIDKRIFALSFSGGKSLIKENYLENNFGIKTNRKLIDNQKLKSIKSVFLHDGVISNHRSAKTNIPAEYQLDVASLNVVSDIKGSIQDEFLEGLKVTVSGQNQIQLSVDEESNFLPQLIRALKFLLNVYLDDEEHIDKFNWNNEIKREKNLEIIESLDKILAEKIKTMIKTVNLSKNNQVTRVTLENIQLYPNIPDLEENPILGFNVSGIGFPQKRSLEKLDEVQIFSRLALFLKNKYGIDCPVEEIISKLKTDHVYYYQEEGIPIYLSKIYNSLYFQTSLVGDNKNKHILFQGNWYEIPKDFYSYLENKINDISNDPAGINYIEFTNRHREIRQNQDVISSEGEYNKAMSLKENLVLFDSKNYHITADNAQKYNLISSSKIEPCDILEYKNETLQLIHVKKGRNGAGISHLLNQAYVSSVLYKKDPDFLTHMNRIIQEQTDTTIDFNAITNKVIIVLACIVEPSYVTPANSKTFPLLTAVSIVQTVSKLEDLGFECRLVKIPDRYEKITKNSDEWQRIIDEANAQNI